VAPTPQNLLQRNMLGVNLSFRERYVLEDSLLSAVLPGHKFPIGDLTKLIVNFANDGFDFVGAMLDVVDQLSDIWCPAEVQEVRDNSIEVNFLGNLKNHSHCCDVD
jgi:hypothetical protein